MNEMTGEKGTAMRVENSERLRVDFHTAFTQLRGGEDAAGIESLLAAEIELEKLVDNHQDPIQQLDLGQLLPALRTLLFYLQNQDIAGIADLLEDTLCPLTGQWLRGCDAI